METVFGSPNMTVAYHVTGGDIVYLPSAVMEALAYYGRDKLIADLRQYLPLVTALPLPVALWRPSPATGFQLKTGQPVLSWDEKQINKSEIRLRITVICSSSDCRVEDRCRKEKNMFLWHHIREENGNIWVWIEKVLLIKHIRSEVYILIKNIIFIYLYVHIFSVPNYRQQCTNSRIPKECL